MRDWEAFVRQHLRLPELKPEREKRIVRELAAQFEDFYRDALSRGLTEDGADQFAQRQIRDWEGFASDIRRADRPHIRPRLDQWSEKTEEVARRRGGGWLMFADLQRDVLYGLRMLRKNPGFTAVAVLTLALGIGANTAIFSVVNGVLLEPLPLPEPERLVQLWEVPKRGGFSSVSYLNFLDWDERTTTIEHLSYLAGGRMAVVGGKEPVNATVVQVDRDFFSVMSVQPRMGRSFLPEEQPYNGTREAIISHGFWQGQLGANSNLSDISLKISGFEVPIVGVLPPDFDFPPGSDIWIPGNVFPPPPPEILQATRTGHNYRVIGRLRPEVSLSKARAEMTTIAQQLQEEFKGTNDAFDILIVPLHEQIIGASRTPLLILMGSAGLLLLLASANVANLLLAKAVGRQKELAVRSALGAGPGRLFQQLLTENLLLSLTGGFLGVLLAQWLLSLLPLLNPGNLPRFQEVTINGTVLIVTFATSVLVALVVGAAPAFQATRLNLQETLKEGGRSGGSAGTSHRLRGALVVSEIALAVILLVGAGLLTSSLWQLLSVEPGFNPENVLTMRIGLPSGKYVGHAERTAFFTELEQHTQALPGVREAGIISHVPLFGFTPSGLIKFEGRPDVEDEWGQADYRIVSANYFRTMGIPLLQGRHFVETDMRESEHIILVNQAFADRYYPDEDAVGQRIGVAGFESGQGQLPLWIRIAGVVGNVKHRGLHRQTRPETYVTLTQRSGFAGWALNLVLRAEGDPEFLIKSLRKQVHEMDSELPLDFRTMDTIIEASYAGRRFQMLLIGGFALLGLVLASIGIYGVISYSVNQQTHEIGIRIALGAQRGDILKLVIGQGMMLTLIGVAVGLAGAFALTRFLQSLLFGVAPTDPATFAGVAVLLAAVALLACYLPARRATKVDPMVALRYE